jgi:hypothetical protein
MKNLKLVLISAIFLCFVQNSFSASIFSESSIAEKPKHAHEISAQDRAAMEEFVKLTPKQYGEIRGKKLSFVEKVEFKVLQRKLKKQLYYGDDSSGFNIGGFALGFLLGLIGILLAYIFSQDRNFRKWAWIGLGIWVGILIILIATVGSATY